MRGTLELPPSRIVNRPQADRTRREWVSLVVSTLALYDVAYLFKAGADSEGVPLGLWPFDPNQVTPLDLDTNLFSTAAAFSDRHRHRDARSAVDSAPLAATWRA